LDDLVLVGAGSAYTRDRPGEIVRRLGDCLGGVHLGPHISRLVAMANERAAIPQPSSPQQM
jgi:hypothetical protein